MNKYNQYFKIYIILRRIFAKYFSTFIYFFIKAKIAFVNFNKKPPILVLTFGKVGSSSVYITIKEKQKKNSVFHIHFLAPKRIVWAEKFHKNAPRNSVPLHILVSKAISKKLEKYDGKLSIISILREPVGRKLSSIFQNSNLYHGLEKQNLRMNKVKICNELKQIFENENSLHFEETWLENELVQHLGIDIYSTKFDSSIGYKIFKKKKINLLLLRMEDLNNKFEQSIKEFLNLKVGYKLIKKNIGESKYYSESYLEIKKKFKIDQSVFQRIINSKYFKHFYSDYKEIIERKWLKV